MRRRLHKSVIEGSSSSDDDDDDAFSAFSKGRGKKKNANNNNKESSKSPEKETKDDAVNNKRLLDTTNSAAADTSSNKRHHHISSERQAKMDALLQELEEGPTISKISTNRPPPDKRGSFVEPGEEHLTTNIFVGNLAPSVTEEQLTEAFRQFGDLYSVKIMWPRTAEERARGRNTGFVCFMIREDAEEAMDAYQDSDPHFNCGRRLCLRWGKNVKKTVKRGTGGVPIAPIKGARKGGPRNQKEDYTNASDFQSHNLPSNRSTGPNHIESYETNNETPKKVGLSFNSEIEPSETLSTTSSSNYSSKVPNSRVYDSKLHSDTAIRVHLPKDPYRLKFIATVASFVAKDGSILERSILDKESNNPKFFFLKTPLEESKSVEPNAYNMNSQGDLLQEQIFYRWRVYAFTQGDGFESWRTEPFVMFEPNGHFWIPPPLLDQDAARREQEEAKKREDNIRIMKDERRKLAGKKGFMTGRQLEHAKFGNVAKGGGTDKELHEEDLEEWHNIIDHKLCATKESICHAMVFCFDKSGAAKQISQLLKDALLDDRPCVETRIARLFLMSDVLFNSQQPGVRNAFRYRDAIEAMAPDVFTSLGKHKTGGRMTMNKLRNAVSSVLSAWTNWSVYNVIFMDELQTRFDGKEWNPNAVAESFISEENKNEETDTNISNESEKAEEEQDDEELNQSNTVNSAPRGDWVDADMIPPPEKQPKSVDDDIDGEALSEDDDVDVDGESLSDDDILNENMSDDEVDDKASEDNVL